MKHAVTRLAVGGAVALALTAAAQAPSYAASHTASHTVSHHKGHHKTWTVSEKKGTHPGKYVFAPSSLMVHVGDTVVFVDKSKPVPHNIVGINKASKAVIDRAAVNTATYKVTFKKAGTYRYQCQIHPGMVGEIKVMK